MKGVFHTMDSTLFWDLIEQVNTTVGFGTGEAEDYIAFQMEVANKLISFGMPEMMVWQHIFNEYQILSNKSKLWAAAYVINGGCSDDWFDYFRAWLTAQGRTIFMAALKNPDSLSEIKEAIKYEPFFEEMLSVGLVAYHLKMELVDQIKNREYDYDAFYAELHRHCLNEEEKSMLALEIDYDDEIDMKWDEDSLKSLVPRLCKEYGW